MSLYIGDTRIGKVKVATVATGVEHINLPTPNISVSTSGLITASVTNSTSGFVDAGANASITQQLSTVNGTTVTPTASEQTIAAAYKYTLGALKVSAVPTETKSITANGTYTPTSGKWFSSVTVNVAGGGGTTINNQNKTVNPSTSQQSVTFDAAQGYTGLGTVTVTAMPGITLPTSATSSATSGYTSKATITPSTSDQYLNISTGYNSSNIYYKINKMTTGSATGPTSLSGTSASITTGSNTITLTKTGVSTTPTVSAGYVSSATSSTATVALTASVTTKAAATYHPSTSAQSISSGTYLIGAQTIAAVTTSNLSASNIVSGVTIKVGDASDDDCVASVTGNVVLQDFYTGTSNPNNSMGKNGDIYLQIEPISV